MDDLDQLLNDLENVNSKKIQKQDPDYTTKLNENSDFINSINRIINTSDTSNANTTTANRMGSLTTLATNTSSNYSITNDEFESETPPHTHLQVNTSRIADLTELDSLLDDLYQAKQKFANANKPLSSLSSVTTTGSGSESSSSYSPVSSLFKSNSDSRNSSSIADTATKELDNLMQNLNMYKSEPTTTEIPIIFERQQNLCFSCQQPISGQVITALGSLWHPNHFVCYHCQNSIGTSIFYEKDNRPYCEHDYLNLFSPHCSSCSYPILDKMLTALNKTWHISCFRCLSCKKVLNDESFLEINDEAYCKNCYVNELAPKCKRCNHAIVENFISAMDSYWHPSCFVCQECGVTFNTSNFYEYNNMPYCENHYHLKRGSLCGGCQSPINGRCITAMNKKFHPEHFNCSFCLKQLNKGTFKEQNEKPYCQTCFIKLFP